MIRYWTGFAPTRQPNGPTVPPWLPCRASDPVLQNLAPGAVEPLTSSTFSADHHCGFWGQLP